MKYLLLDGLHKTKEGLTCKKGDIVESHMPLDKLFREKFRQVSDEGVAVIHDGPPIDAANAGVATSPADAALAKYGNDVTDVADHRAADLGLRIFHKSGWFTVIDQDGSMVGDKKFRRQDLTDYLNELFTAKADEES